MTYPMTVAGLHRDLPICKVTDDLYIGAFIVFGDAELTVACARELLKLVPAEDYDYMLTAEAKSIPLIHEMARQSGAKKYFIARKGPKAYMPDPIHVEDTSITTAGTQRLYLGRDDAELIRGKRILLMDDVISTGGSLHAMEELVALAGGTVTGRVDAVHMVERISPEGSKLFEVEFVVDNAGSLTADMVASAVINAGGETIYPYESGKLEYNRTGELKSTVGGTVISSSLLDYLPVKAGQVLVRIDGQNSENVQTNGNSQNIVAGQNGAAGQNTSGNQNSAGKKAVKTGDTDSILLWAVMLGMSGAAAVLLKKKREMQ